MSAHGPSISQSKSKIHENYLMNDVSTALGLRLDPSTNCDIEQAKVTYGRCGYMACAWDPKGWFESREDCATFARKLLKRVS